jgi:thiol-disulfide isomerase/thioredoxin
MAESEAEGPPGDAGGLARGARGDEGSGLVKKWLTNAVTLFLVAAAGIVLMLQGAGGNLLPVGADAPAFDLERHGGAGRFTSAELKGKVVMLDFWATWCGPCREEMPWLVELAREYEGKGVQLVAASHDEPDERQGAIDAFAKNDVPGVERYAAYGDPFTSGKYRVEALPTLYVIGKDGKIVASVRGSVSEWRVRRWLNAALEQ